MTLKSKKHGKSVLLGRSIRGTDTGAPAGALNKDIGAPLSTSGKSMRHVCIPISEQGIYTMTKEDIEREIAKGEKEFGMPIKEFYKAWQEDKVHGFHAMKLVCLYDFYRKEYE